MSKRLYRSSESKVIGGVCGGLGEHFDIDPTWIRLLFVLLIFASGLGLLVYIIGWIVIPRHTALAAVVPPVDTEGETTPGKTQSRHGPGFLPGIILIGLGMVFLLQRFFFWFDFEYIWPLILIGLGAALIYRALAPPIADDAADRMAARPTEVDNGR